MILVTVGHIEFQRLTRAMDLVAKTSNEEIVMQIGYKPHYLPQNAKYFDFVDRTEMSDYFSRSEVIISHCSVSSILYAVNLHKPLVAVPRMSRNKEHMDDHQLDLARELEKGSVIDGLFIIYDISKLEETIKVAKNAEVACTLSESKKALIEGIKQFINDNAEGQH